MNTELVTGINHSLEIDLPATVSQRELREQLAAHINYLINHNFEKLVYYLYRIDVNENKMRYLLEQKQGENAAALIADLIIERQLQKIKSRNETRSNKDISDDEKW